MADQWTVDRVKEELPKVKLKVRGSVFLATVSGRRNQFATVSLGLLESYQFAWQTIANALNNGSTLLVE